MKKSIVQILPMCALLFALFPLQTLHAQGARLSVQGVLTRAQLTVAPFALSFGVVVDMEKTSLTAQMGYGTSTGDAIFRINPVANNTEFKHSASNSLLG